jgi:hypothetical protein
MKQKGVLRHWPRDPPHVRVLCTRVGEGMLGTFVVRRGHGVGRVSGVSGEADELHRSFSRANNALLQDDKAKSHYFGFAWMTNRKEKASGAILPGRLDSRGRLSPQGSC